MIITHPTQQKTALWVLAHPHADSFNGTLFREGVAELSLEYTVRTTDLYAQGFDPVLSDRDLGTPTGRSGNIARLSGEAYGRGELDADVREEQEKLAAAELLVLQFPLWWYSEPAILKGWIDRVFTEGFAYGDIDPERGVPRRYGDGGLSGRKALVIVTTGEDERSIGPRGISDDIDALLFPLTHGVLWYVGIETLALHVVADADALGPAEVARESARLRERLHGITAERPRLFRRLRDGEYNGTRALREDILPGRTDFGIHLAQEK